MIPTAAEIRRYLEGYGLDSTETVGRVGDVTASSAEVVGVDTRGLTVGMRVAGAGIPLGAVLQEIVNLDHPSGTIVLDVIATASADDVVLTFVGYTCVSDEWITQRRDNTVIPWVVSKLGRPVEGEHEITEYYDGTGSSVLVLRVRPVRRFISVLPVGLESGFGTEISPVAVQLIPDEGILKAKADPRGSSWLPVFARGTRNLVVRYVVGDDTIMPTVKEAVIQLCCEQILGHIANMTGGGDRSVAGFSTTFGDRGKWTNARADLSRMAIALLRIEITGAGS